MFDEGSRKVWINVTTSANWNRPPVGIVRVEQVLAQELELILGKKIFHRCIWLDGQFVEWNQSAHNLMVSKNEEIVDDIFPQTSSFDLARKFLRAKLSNAKIKEKNKKKVIAFKHSTGAHHPQSGDILISVGLDWDQPYTQAFYDLQKKRGIHVITCCYDLIPVLFPQYCVGEVAKWFKEYFIQLSWGSTAVLCISKQTQNDYLNLCSELGVPERKTQIIPLGDNVPENIGEISEDVLKLVEEPFILFVSTIERRKNHEVLYRAYHLLCREGHKDKLPKLVFVGMAGWGVGDLLKDIELDPLTQGLIVQLNHLSDAALGLLYKKALFCVYPSLYEGWGLPVGEALAQGKVVVASDQGSLPEVGGDLVRYIKPWNPQAWADEILMLLENTVFRGELEERIKNEYRARSWKQTALSVKEVIDEIWQMKPKEIVLYPGYDMSTQIGIHEGSAIRSVGTGGFLLYGPHHSIGAGSYTLTLIYTNLSLVESNLTLEFACEGGSSIVHSEAFWINSEIGVDKKIQFNVNLNKAYSDYEIRLIIGESLIKVSEIRITPVNF